MSRRGLLAAAALAPLLLLAPAGTASDRVLATLKPGQAAFWSPAPGSGTRVYRLAVRPGGVRLRVSFDTADFRDGISGSVVSPGGTSYPLYGLLSGEVYVPRPAAGTWEVRVTADHAEFRLRAKLETAPARPRKAVPLLPNLRLVPPYEFTFSGSPGGARTTGVALPVASCSADDVAEGHAARCLRFSLGPANVGAGPLLLRFPGNAGLVAPGEATQLVTWSDGRVTSRRAGTFEYHKTHAHYHHSGFGRLELLKVTDPARGTMVPAGAGPKLGYCTSDIMFADWGTFGADKDSAHSTCLDNTAPVYDPTAGTSMGLSPGWADIYAWEQDGNFVDFGLNPDGRYVVRSTADALGNVLESDESDNTAYAYVEVTGLAVRVLERGRGTGPWDPRKVLAHDLLPPVARV